MSAFDGHNIMFETNDFIKKTTEGYFNGCIYKSVHRKLFLILLYQLWSVKDTSGCDGRGGNLDFSD